MIDQPLHGGLSTSGVVRISDTVRRPIIRDATCGHDCRLHLESIDFQDASRFRGIDDAGSDAVPADLRPYSDEHLAAAAKLLRRFHDATVDMTAVRVGGFEVACHNDWAPTNTVFVDGMPTAMIDSDTARPGERLWDLGYSSFTWLDLGNDDYARDKKVRRLRVFAAGYDLAQCSVVQIAV